MSAFRKAAPRRTHRERAQPAGRTHLGLLEKKKDYKLRARDYHRKETALKNLRAKAATRNPDEFYYRMIRSKTVGGVHKATRKSRLPDDILAIMKDQDVNYLRTMIAQEKKALNAILPLGATVDGLIADAKAAVKAKQVNKAITLQTLEGDSVPIGTSRVKFVNSDSEESGDEQESSGDVDGVEVEGVDEMMSEGDGDGDDDDDDDGWSDDEALLERLGAGFGGLSAQAESEMKSGPSAGAKDQLDVVGPWTKEKRTKMEAQAAKIAARVQRVHGLMRAAAELNAKQELKKKGGPRKMVKKGSRTTAPVFKWANRRRK